MPVVTRTSPASDSRHGSSTSPNAARATGVSTPPNAARTGGERTPEGGTAAVAMVTGSPGARSDSLTWLANATNEAYFDVGTAGNSLCLQAKDRSDVEAMIDDIKEATTAVTADSVDVLKAWLNNGTQKVLVVVAKDSTRPTARLLHSPAMASMSGTTITMVAGELDADNRANIVEVNEAELHRSGDEDDIRRYLQPSVLGTCRRALRRSTTAGVEIELVMGTIIVA